MLKSLELAGFKSFAKKSELRFNHSVTAIVGPNGSGKSNLAEAFRFVLGEQSIKSLRGKKTEDLVWNGSKEVPKSNRASVKLVFDNQKRLFNLDFDEVSVERVIYRDASSEYLLNGTQVRLKDILELLSQAHIGASGHHIISQGEADRILSANLKGRREMIEDALGLKIYQYKKEEALRKLEKTEENVKQVESLRREIAPHLRFLKKQVEKVEKVRELKSELERLYQEYLKRESVYISHFKAKLSQEKSPIGEKLKELSSELKEAKATLSASSSKDEKSEQVIVLEKKLQECRLKKDVLTKSLGRLEGELSASKRLLDKLERDNANSSQVSVPISELESLNSSLDDKLKTVDSGADSLKKVLDFVVTKLKEIIRNANQASMRLSNKEPLADIEKFQKEKSLKEEELAVLLKEETLTLETYDKLRSELEAEKDKNREAEKAVFRIMAEENDFRARLRIIEEKEARLALEETDFKREIQEGIALIGRLISNYQNFEITEAGVTLKDEILALEPRVNQEERRKAIEKIKIRLEDSGATGAEEILKEHQETAERDSFLARELQDLANSKNSLTELIKDLELRLDLEFKEGIKKINAEFQRFFALMFGGGSASLQVIKEKIRPEASAEADFLEDQIYQDGEEKVDEGLDISVTLPHKKTKGLMMLSGGERSLVSIALLFAMSAVNPPPFVILDETDAALDEANSKKYGDMVENLSKYSQLILITHNRETMSRSGILYGVTMLGGVSKLLSVAFEEAVKVAK